MGLRSSSPSWVASTQRLFQSMFRGRPAAQLALIQTVTSPSAAALCPDMSLWVMALSLVVRSSGGADSNGAGQMAPAHFWLASEVACAMLWDNCEMKNAALLLAADTIDVSTSKDSAGVPLLQRCSRLLFSAMRSESHPLIQLGLLRLLLVWLWGSSEVSACIGGGSTSPSATSVTGPGCVTSD